MADVNNTLVKIVENMRKSTNSVSVQVQSCSLLCQGIMEGEGALVDALVGAGVIGVLVEALTAQKGNEAIVGSVLNSFHFLCLDVKWGPEHREQLGREGAIDAIFSLMEGTKSVPVELYCVSTLLALCRDCETNCRRLGSKGVRLVASKIAKLHSYPNISYMVRIWLESCSDMLYHVGSKEGVMAILMAALTNYDMAADVQKAAFCALHRILESEGQREFADKVQEKGGLRLIIKNMKMHRDDVDVQICGAIAVCPMVMLLSNDLDAAARKKYIQAVCEVYESAAKGISEIYKTVEGRETVVALCNYVSNLVSSHAAHMLPAASEGCIAAAAKIMRVDIANADMQGSCLRTVTVCVIPDLSNVHVPSCQQFVQAGLIPHVLDAMRRHVDDDRIMSPSALLLGKVSNIQPDYSAACKHAVPVIVKAMRLGHLQKNYEFIGATAFRALEDLCEGCHCASQNASTAAKLGMVRLGMDIARACKDENFQEHGAICVVARIGIEEPQSLSVITHQDVDRVIKSMRSLTSDAAMQSVGVNFIFACSRFSTQLQELLGLSDAHKALFEAMEAHPQDVVLCKNILSALKLFAKDHSKNKDRISESGLRTFVRAVRVYESDPTIFMKTWLTMLELCKDHPRLHAKMQELVPEMPLYRELMRNTAVTIPKDTNQCRLLVVKLRDLLNAGHTDLSAAEVLTLEVSQSEASQSEASQSEASQTTEASQTGASKASGDVGAHKVCVVCGKNAHEAGLKVLRKCSGCTIAPMYCSPQCQKTAWPQHKAECKANSLRQSG